MNSACVSARTACSLSLSARFSNQKLKELSCKKLMRRQAAGARRSAVQLKKNRSCGICLQLHFNGYPVPNIVVQAPNVPDIYKSKTGWTWIFKLYIPTPCFAPLQQTSDIVGLHVAAAIHCTTHQLCTENASLTGAFGNGHFSTPQRPRPSFVLRMR